MRENLSAISVGNEQFFFLSSYPLVRAPASGQHEDVLHLPLLLLLLNFAPLLFGDDIVPFSYGPPLELWSGLFHAGEIGNLQQYAERREEKKKEV